VASNYTLLSELSARAKKKARVTSHSGPDLIPGSDLLSHPPARAVPSAVAGLTSVFGMGTGVTLLLWPPGNLVPGVSVGGRGMRAADHANQVIPEHIGT